LRFGDAFFSRTVSAVIALQQELFHMHSNTNLM
jgi:hypothetical protein